ncbi:MAG: hypothetical protein WKG07_19360 [Hymenobacter sp.]
MMTEADYYALFEAYARGELAAPARADLCRPAWPPTRPWPCATPTSPS